MILLTSSVASVADHLFKKFLVDKGYKTVLFIDTAAETEIGKVEGDDDWLQADLQSLQKQGYQVDRYSITDKTLEEITSKIDTYDILYMCGGNTAHLLDQLQRTGAYNLIIEKVNKGKPYIGTSAGSLVAGPHLPEYLYQEEPKLSDYSGFGFVNFIPVPHWGSEHFYDLYFGGRLKSAYNANHPPYLLLSDLHYIFVSDSGEVKVINTNEK